MIVDDIIDSEDKFMRLKVIKPKMTLMDERRHLLNHLIKKREKKAILRNHTIAIEKLVLKINNIEKRIINENKN